MTQVALVDDSRPPPLINPMLALVVMRAQAGDEAAFERLFRTFSGRTLGYLRGILLQEAEDLQQEVWLTVYRQLSGLADPRLFRTWLYRITRHKVVDRFRQLRRERTLFAEPEAGNEIPGPDSADDGDDLRELDSELAQLSPTQREVLLLRHRDDLSYEEIAAIVGCAVGTVRSRLFTARRRLRQLRAETQGNW